ncbi:TniQ family protein [Paenibacillus marchantiae]|uniref:TniQ family protein n=1 Tax=Paenibacillus marchantiae TaxID=3026433 RepID=UPI00237ADEE6|nr:TniQ family protein [Paenibacillus marchantiae]WDQ32190.1 TniQ family protein [Paenibacillus marchantiae]
MVIYLDDTYKVPYKVSRLYALKPEGLQTGLKEGIVSYITRLAAAHHICMGDLIKGIISSELEREYLQNDISRGGSRFYQRAKSLNGVGLHTKSIVDILSMLTTVDKLENLTLLPWEEVICDKYLFKPSKAWCAQCYHEWNTEGKPLYEPLLWSIKLTSVYPIHNSPLTMSCPNQSCRKTISHLSRNSAIGFCPHCSSWLGQNSNHIVLNENTSQLRNSLTLLQLIAKIQRHSICRKNIQDSFQVLLTYTHGNISRLANLISMNRCTVWQYCNGAFIPPLPTILEICNHLNIDLIDFLLGNISHLNMNLTYQMPSIERFCVNKISNDISAKNKEFKNSKKILNYEKTCEDIERAVLSLNESGYYPSKRNVERVLQRSGILQRPTYKNIWRTMKQKQVYKGINMKAT